MAKMNEGIQRSSSWLTSMALCFLFLYILSVLCRSRGRESTGNGENPPEFDLILVRIRIIGRATELQLVVDIVVRS